MPDKLGFSPSRLAAIDRFIDNKYIKPGRLAGTQILVARHGEIAHSSVAGMADIARGKPMAEDTIFRIYSMTKPITSVALMMLVEEGKIALDDPVHRYIPEWRGMGVYSTGTFRTGFATKPTKRAMLVVDLLRHTAGLTYGFQLRTNVDAAYRAAKIGEIEKAGTLDDMIAALAKLPLEFSPGDAWNYSVATDVVGYLVGKVAGEPFEAFLKRRIFDPLGMVDTGFNVREGQQHRFAACYSVSPTGALDVQDDAEGSSFLKPATFISGGGGLVSTAADYLKFAQAMLTGKMASGETLIGRKTLALMVANHLPGGVDLPAMSVSLFSEASYEGTGFGLGFATSTKASRTLMPGSDGDYFWGGAASTFFWVDPVEDLVAVFMTQLMPSSFYPVRRELRTMVYAALDD